MYLLIHPLSDNVSHREQRLEWYMSIQTGDDVNRLQMESWEELELFFYILYIKTDMHYSVNNKYLFHINKILKNEMKRTTYFTG